MPRTIFQKVSFRVLAAIIVIMAFFLVSSGGALIAIVRFNATFAEIAGSKLSDLIAASHLVRSSKGIAENAPNLAVATTQMMRETASDQIDDQVALLSESLQRVKGTGAETDRFSRLQNAKDDLVELLKSLNDLVRQQIDLDEQFVALLDQLRDEASRIGNVPLRPDGALGTLSDSRTGQWSGAEQWVASANEAIAVMLAVVGRNDAFQLEKSRRASLQLWLRMEGVLPDVAPAAIMSLHAEIRHVGLDPGSIFDVRLAQIRCRDAIQGTLTANRRASARLVSVASDVFAEFEANIQQENAYFRRSMYYYLVFFSTIALFCTAVGVWIFNYIDRGVIRRLKLLQECMRASVESRQVDIPTAGHDEIAEMARATEYFITTIGRREDALNRIFEAAPIPMTLVRLDDGRILRANGRAIKQFGITLASGCSATRIYRDAWQRSEFLKELAQTGFVDGHEAKLDDATSRPFWALIAGQLIESDGELCCLVGATDISLLKEAERAQRIAMKRAEEATAAKSRFLTNLSHELRTPLNAIIGLTEVLYDGASHFGTERAREPLSRVAKAGRHLLQLMNAILDISKVDSGKMDLIVEEVPIASLIDEVVGTVALLAERNGNCISISRNSDAVVVRADRMRLRQVLLNLMSNASKFTSRGVITLAVEKKPVDGYDWISFRVTDTGVGISEQHIERLFEEFGQADASTSRQYGGTGLGLAISDRLCRLMGGKITVTSQLGVGSTFVVHLPDSVERHSLRRQSQMQRL
jgi:signal transduction histidine kinase